MKGSPSPSACLCFAKYCFHRFTQDYKTGNKVVHVGWRGFHSSFASLINAEAN